MLLVKNISEQNEQLLTASSKTLLRGGIGSAIIKLISAALSFGMFLFAGRALDIETYSEFGLGFSIATLLVLVGSIGQRLLALKCVPIFDALDDKNLLQEFTRQGYFIVALGCITCGLVLAAGSAIFPRVADLIFIVSVSFFGLILALAEYQARVLRGLGSLYLALLPREVIWRSLIIIGFFLIAREAFTQPNATAIFALLSLLLLIIILVQAFLNPLTNPLFLFRKFGRLNISVNWNSTAVRFWGSSVLRGATPNCAVILVTLYLSVTASAAYFGAYRLALALNLLVVATNMLSMPLLSRAHHKGDRRDTKCITRFVTLFTSVPTIGLFIVFLIYGDILLSLMNKEYEIAYWPLVILAGGHLIRVLCGPGRALLQMKDREAEFLRITFWTTFAAIMLTLPLTQQFGAIGAAVAASFEVATSGIIAAVVCSRNLDIDPSIFGALNTIAGKDKGLPQK